MHIENEQKFVVKISLYDILLELGYVYKDIEQFYDGRMRFRQSVCGDITEYYFTYKLGIPDTYGHMEIENEISKREYEMAKSRLAETIITKRRFTVDDFEVDFFKDPYGSIYFAVAEIELPEDKLTTDDIPEIVSEHIVWSVPREEQYLISNKRLRDHEMSRIRYKQIVEVQENQNAVSQ